MADCRPLATLLDGVPDDAPAALTDRGTLTRAGFHAAVAAWQARFAREPARRIGLYHEDAAEFAVRLFGAWAAGKQVHLPGDRLPATLARLGTQVDAFAGQLPAALQQEPGDAEATPAPLGATLGREDIALVLMTSGSTGEPVAVGKRLRQLDAEVAALERRFGAELGRAEFAGTVSHQHIYGLLFRVLWPLASGRPLRATRLATPEQMAGHPPGRPLALVASPAHLKRLPEALDWSAFAADLVHVFSSGGPLAADASDAALALWGRRPVEVYGSTETGGIAERADPRGAWTPLPGVEWRLDNDQLAIRSAHLPSATAWFQTADRAAGEGAGFVLLGRADRIAKIEERRVSLDAIERRLGDVPGLGAARVLLLPGERALVAVVAEITSEGAVRLEREGRHTFVRNIRGWLVDHVDPVALPRRWRFVDRLPVNAQGKTTEAALAALFRPTLPTVEWIERGERAATLAFDADAGLAMFDGHFPQAPVLPGVAQLDWALHFGREAFAPAGEPLRVEQLKFQALVRPGMHVTLALEWAPATGVLGFRYTSAAGTHASGRLVFAPHAPEPA
jgi:acyl-CoA synthetase (AMP-forming)/AMP-acid ligase II